MPWRWVNVPIPEAHLAALGVGALLHDALPVRVPIGRSPAVLAGWSLVTGGVALGAWAVASASAADVEVDRPAQLVRSGAYRVSRNPMYLAWSLGHLGLGLLTRSGWILLGSALATVAVHRDVAEEEASLAAAFGADYDAYRAEVPRYLPLTSGLSSVASAHRMKGRNVNRRRSNRDA